MLTCLVLGAFVATRKSIKGKKLLFVFENYHGKVEPLGFDIFLG